MMMTVPKIKVGARFKSPSIAYDNKHDKTMEIDVANVFKMLSANLMVAATITPPIAFYSIYNNIYQCKAVRPNCYC